MIGCELDSLPEETKKLINLTCTRILVAATISRECEFLPENVCFGAFQKALGLFIAKCYEKDVHSKLIEELYKGMKLNVAEFSKSET